jgi:ribose transport system substrate-binding protein
MFRLGKSAAVVGLIVSLAASGACAKKSETRKIGLAVANLQAEFFNMIKQSVEAYGKEKGYTVITVDAKGDATTQVNQIQDLITQNIDALIYIPAGATAASVPVKAAPAAGIPVVNVDRNAESAPGDVYIRSDSVQATKVMAEWVCKQAGGKGNAVIIHGQKGTSPEVDRSKGFSEGLKACPAVSITQEQWTERWAADEGNKIAQDMLQRDPTIAIIFGEADGIALGAAQAVKLAKPDHKVWVIGYDGDIGGLKGVQSGTLDATITQPTFAMGRMAVDAVTELLAKRKPNPDQPTDGVLTTMENVQTFLKIHP